MKNLTMAPIDGVIDTLPEHSKERSSILIEPTKKVNISIEQEPRVIYLAQSLSIEERNALIRLFEEKQINFVWSYTDMPGLDPTLVLHHLNISQEVKPVKQKLRKMHPHIALLVKAKLEKLINTNFIRPLAYASWISNIVPISKKNGSICICINFSGFKQSMSYR